MKQQKMAVFSEDEFQARLHELTAGQSVGLTLQHSDGTHLYTLFDIGTGYGHRSELVEHQGGYYLVGEGVPPELLGPIHDLFVRYCRSHGADSKAHVHLHYKSFFKHHAHQMRMHFPTRSGKFHPPFRGF